MGLIGTPPVLLALLLLAGLSSEAKAQVSGDSFISISSMDIYEGERLEFTLTVDFDYRSAYYNHNSALGPSSESTATEGASSDWYLATSSSGSRVTRVSESNARVQTSGQNGTITFFVQANSDSSSEGDETIILRDYDFYGTFSGHTVTITLKDGARPSTPTDGVTISETSLALTELGASSAVEKTYTVVLDTNPTADVTITVANGDNTAVAVDTDSGTSGDQNTLTFTAGGDGSGSGAGNGNWAVAQTATVRALNDADAANESFNLTHAATTTGSTAPYHGITIDPVAITTADAGHGWWYRSPACP